MNIPIEVVSPILSGALIVIITLFINATVKRWKKQDNQTTIYRYKVDSMVYALSHLGTSIGEHFKELYEEKFTELVKENKLENELQ